MYCKRTSDTDSDKPDISEEIFFAIRTIFLYNASFKGMYAIHSASVLYKDKAWLFSGHSGAGKSTLQICGKNFLTRLSLTVT